MLAYRCKRARYRRRFSERDAAPRHLVAARAAWMMGLGAGGLMAFADGGTAEGGGTSLAMPFPQLGWLSFAGASTELQLKLHDLLVVPNLVLRPVFEDDDERVGLVGREALRPCWHVPRNHDEQLLGSALSV